MSDIANNLEPIKYSNWLPTTTWSLFHTFLKLSWCSATNKPRRDTAASTFSNRACRRATSHACPPSLHRYCKGMVLNYLRKHVSISGPIWIRRLHLLTVMIQHDFPDCCLLDQACQVKLTCFGDSAQSSRPLTILLNRTCSFLTTHCRFESQTTSFKSPKVETHTCNKKALNVTCTSLCQTTSTVDLSRHVLSQRMRTQEVDACADSSDDASSS